MKSASRKNTPKGIVPRLLVLCGHEPTLDPRIHWAADAAARRGWDVRVHGFVLGDVKPKFADPNVYKTSRGRVGDGGHDDRAFGADVVRRGLLPRRFVVVYAVMKVLGSITGAIGTVLSSIWSFLDAVLGAVSLNRITTRPLSWFGRKVWRVVADTVHKLTNSYFRRLNEGVKGYAWYFRVLVLKQAMAARHHFVGRDWKPDVIHANDPDCLLAAALLAQEFNCRLVYDAHEYGPEAYLMEATPRQAFFAYEKRVMKRVDTAMTVTPQIAAKFQKRYKGKPYFHVVPNATPTPSNEIFVPLDDPFMRTAAAGRVRVIFQGGFAANRGVEELIDAWKSVDESKGALFIRGPENSYRAELVDRARATGRLGKSLFFLPSVAEDDLVKSALNADVGVISYLSRVENHHGACPNKTSQYMQAGLMLVSVKLPFVASVIESAGSGITFDDTTEGAFAAALNRAIEDEVFRRECQIQGRRYARAIFNYGTYVPVIEALYEGQEPPSDVPHTRLNETPVGPLSEDQPGPPIPDRHAFEASLAEFDRELSLDVSRGDFTQRDLVDLAQLSEALAAESKDRLRWIAMDVVAAENGEEIERLLNDANALYQKAGSNGSGQVSYGEARNLFREAARLGSVQASHMLGVMAQLGQGGEVDFDEAANWYRRAGELGHEKSWRNLGILLQTGGSSLEADTQGAVEAYAKAARSGDAIAAVNAASLMVHSKDFDGRERDAAELIRLALDGQDDRAIDLLDRFVERLGLESYLLVKRA